MKFLALSCLIDDLFLGSFWSDNPASMVKEKMWVFWLNKTYPQNAVQGISLVQVHDLLQLKELEKMYSEYPNRVLKWLFKFLRSIGTGEYLWKKCFTGDG